VLRENARADTCLLVDCLTLWLTNLLMLEDPQRLSAERDALLACLASCRVKLCLSATKPEWVSCRWAN
jgi:adenosyl cobinamide kinase/adenosyl cobinamide phosphate guanylyltransferase